MIRIKSLLGLLGLGLFAFGILTGCESTDGGGSASGSVYYGVGFYDPWYYGDDDYDGDIIVTPPDRPEAPPRPTHPIATPPPSAPRPMPSMPSMPRASPRR
jgi:hypothetical protein